MSHESEAARGMRQSRVTEDAMEILQALIVKERWIRRKERLGVGEGGDAVRGICKARDGGCCRTRREDDDEDEDRIHKRWSHNEAGEESGTFTPDAARVGTRVGLGLRGGAP